MTTVVGLVNELFHPVVLRGIWNIETSHIVIPTPTQPPLYYKSIMLIVILNYCRTTAGNQERKVYQEQD